MALQFAVGEQYIPNNCFDWLFSLLLGSNIFLIIALIIAFVQSFASYWYSDKIVLAMARAKPIKKKDSPELYRIVENLCIAAGLPAKPIKKKDSPELYRIVENLCIAAGLPLPKIYIIEESQPNAFATGRNAEHAVVAVMNMLS